MRSVMVKKYIMGIMEHIEPAGIHSGDSSAVLPPTAFRKRDHDQNTPRRIALQAEHSRFDQHSVCNKGEQVYVIEAN